MRNEDEMMKLAGDTFAILFITFLFLAPIWASFGIVKIFEIGVKADALVYRQCMDECQGEHHKTKNKALVKTVCEKKCSE